MFRRRSGLLLLCGTRKKLQATTLCPPPQKERRAYKSAATRRGGGILGVFGNPPKPLKGLLQGSRKSQRSEIFGKRSGRRNRRGGKHSALPAMAPCRRRVGGASLRCIAVSLREPRQSVAADGRSRARTDIRSLHYTRPCARRESAEPPKGVPSAGRRFARANPSGSLPAGMPKRQPPIRVAAFWVYLGIRRNP